MRLILDSEKKTLTVTGPDKTTELTLYSREAFEALSREWVRVGWSLEYFFTFTWMGLPILQLPEDLVRLQEVLFRLKPDIIVETGVCFGGSLLYYASLMSVWGPGRAIGIERKFAPETRDKLLQHPLGSRITLVEGDSAAPETLEQVKRHIAASDKVMVILDSDHSKNHVAAELRSYSQIVSPGSCLLVADAIMQDLHDVPGGQADWTWNHPGTAVSEFLKANPEFHEANPAWLFNQSPLRCNITYWPGGWLWRKDAEERRGIR